MGQTVGRHKRQDFSGWRVLAARRRARAAGGCGRLCLASGSGLFPEGRRDAGAVGRPGSIPAAGDRGAHHGCRYLMEPWGRVLPSLWHPPPPRGGV